MQPRRLELVIEADPTRPMEFRQAALETRARLQPADWALLECWALAVVQEAAVDRSSVELLGAMALADKPGRG